MSNVNGLISAPVNLAGDVFKVLQAAPVDGEYKLGYANSNGHGKTNKWAKRKPVKRSGLFASTPGAGDGQWYFGEGDYGIKTIQFDNIKTMVDYVQAGGDGWEYDPPTGGGRISI